MLDLLLEVCGIQKNAQFFTWSMSAGALRAILKENKTVPTTLERKWL